MEELDGNNTFDPINYKSGIFHESIDGEFNNNNYTNSLNMKKKRYAASSES